jgi:protein MpaA
MENESPRPQCLSRRCALACLTAVLALVAGCYTPSYEPEDPVVFDPAPQPEPTVCTPAPEAPAKSSTRPRVELVGLSVRGQAIWAKIFDGTKGTILILGGIHGNEPISSELMDMLTEHLEANPEALCGRRVILVNRANPDGLDNNTRHNVRGVDLNRNFPSANFAPCARHGKEALSEPETEALRDLVCKYRPQAVVSVHGPLNCIDPDGGANSMRLARVMTRVSPLPIDDLRAFPGSMGSYCGETMKMAMVTYELDRKDVPATGLEEYLKPHLAPMLAAIKQGAKPPALGEADEPGLRFRRERRVRYFGR